MLRRFAKPVVIVSRCLTGELCRYDGERLLCRFVKQLRPWVRLIKVCPEMEIGLGVPRDRIQVVRAPHAGVSLNQPATGRNLTRTMTAFARSFVKTHRAVGDGFILKSKSPSCGAGNTKLFDSSAEDARVVGRTSGLFAAEVFRGLPHLAIEDEQRLDDPDLREHFLTKLFTLAEWRVCRKAETAAALLRFHAYHRLLLRCYSAKHSRGLETVAAEVTRATIKKALVQYEEHLLQAFAKPPRRRAIAAAYKAAEEHYRPHLTATDQRIFHRMLTQYARRELPLSTLRKTVQIWAVRYDKRFIRQHSLYRPYPSELATIERSTT